MEKLADAYIRLYRMLASLAKGIHAQQKISATDEQVMLMMQDTLIKRLEYSYEGFWKFCKKYAVFRPLVKTGLCTETEGDVLVRMSEARNETPHTYDRTMADEIAAEADEYYQCMHTIITRLPMKDNYHA